ncbi:hypothetical protein EOD41_14875 [Mucilaginibacter limnophilus]|uniref:DUF3408 domain-containing protein n=1 Tax=Mucilaginibacter limnophilus TaxID=1932778 RepID=A0A437MQ40_9SPHI|nr:hypothetical protein [Mucilaginibacter limnophilus]RVT99725.1 hypothetical protein EOD41_14875 [Mucilaginibacter limnophilus]
MSEIKSLADQLRSKIAGGSPNPPAIRPAAREPPAVPAILEQMRMFNTALHKNMVHVRFDAKTVKAMNNFKLATGVDLNRFIAFSVRHFFDTHPELTDIIKDYIQNLDL